MIDRSERLGIVEEGKHLREVQEVHVEETARWIAKLTEAGRITPDEISANEAHLRELAEQAVTRQSLIKTMVMIGEPALSLSYLYEAQAENNAKMHYQFHQEAYVEQALEDAAIAGYDINYPLAVRV